MMRLKENVSLNLKPSLASRKLILIEISEIIHLN